MWTRPELRIIILVLQKEAEMHLPFLAVREGISLQMEDFDTGVCWSIRYRWVNLFLNFQLTKIIIVRGMCPYLFGLSNLL